MKDLKYEYMIYVWGGLFDDPRCTIKEGYDINFEVWPEDKEDYVLIDGNYEYREEE